ncbi:MAG: type I-E CRISPR-associated protein Cas7/Cse4/CasC [Clostridiaceae bacterium]|nr:type I-E CRISPR-associated protein Cas7/Cse4/CasC [Clostridiaceae bacterium]
MKNKRLYLDLHVIQAVPPSNINRDDTGSPKTAQYGGVRRARVSSQSWKRAIRQYFNANSPGQNVGVRTLNIADYVKDKIRKLDSSIEDADALKMASNVLTKANLKLKDDKARALFFLGDLQAEKLAEAALKGIEEKKELQAILRSNPSIDIALFGRMVADDPSLNEDASAQVAHSISTHAVQTEFDFFTAVDDLQPEDNAGAGMLGTVEYNSSTLYRYANVAVHEFVKQVGDNSNTINALKLFIEAFSNSMPTGKINTFANQTLPQLLLVHLREDRPINLVSVFEEPVRSNKGFSKESIDKIFEAEKDVQRFAVPAKASYYLLATGQKHIDAISTETESLADLVNKVAGDLTSMMDELGD